MTPILTSVLFCISFAAPPQGGTAKPRALPYTATEWRPDADIPFSAYRRSFEARLVSVRFPYRQISNSALASVDALSERPSPLALYRASLAYYHARQLDPDLEPELVSASRLRRLVDAWSAIQAPNSYEYARLGFILNGPIDPIFDLYGLGKRLKAKNPKDFLIAPGLLSQASSHGPKEIEEALSFTKEAERLRPDRPTLSLNVASGSLLLYGINRDRSHLRAAVAALERYVQVVPDSQGSRIAKRKLEAVRKLAN